jgi:integrase
LKPHLGAVLLSELRTGHIAAMFRGIEASNGTRRRPSGAANSQRIRATLRAALSDAIRQRLINVNVAKLLELPTAKRPAIAVWSPEQLVAFLDSIREDRLYALYRLVAAIGLRRGEVCGLPWDQLDLGEGVVRIARQLVDVGGHVMLGEPKSRYGHRVVALDEDTVAILRAHRRRQLEERMRAAEAWHETDLVFTRIDGQRLNPAYVTRHFSELVAGVGLPPIRLHDLRHTSASLGLMAGESMKEISDRLGHSSITITADTYTHVAPALAREAAQRRAALLRPSPPSESDAGS